MDDLNLALNNSGIGGYLGDAFLNHLCYADDICLISLSSDNVVRYYIIFVHNKFDNVCLIPTLPTTERHVIQSIRTVNVLNKAMGFRPVKVYRRGSLRYNVTYRNAHLLLSLH